MLFMGLLLYIILVALLMFYIEECSVDGSNAQKTSDPALFRKQCRLIFASFNLSSTTSGANPNISFDGCTKLVRELTPKQYWKTPTCRFSVINYLPWVHCVTFSLLTLGGTISPATVAGQALLTLSTIVGMIPTLRLMIHTGIIIFHAIEHGVLMFEIRILNRNPRMLHNVYQKIFFFNFLILLAYNFVLAWVTSLPFYEADWTFSKASFFWLQGMLTIGRGIKPADRISFYSQGGWRSVCVNFAMIVNAFLLSSLVCTIATKIHASRCHATKTIKKSFRSQSPEVYLNIKHLTTSL